ELVIGYAGTRKFADPLLGPPDSSAAEFNGIVVWDLESKRPKLELASFSVPVNQVAISDDGRYLATAADDRKVILWDLQHGNSQVRSWTMPTSSERWYEHLRFGLTFSPRNNLLAISTPDEVMLCRIPSGEIARRISPSGAMAFSPDGSRLAVSHRRFARDPFPGTTLWDVESGTMVARIFTSGADSYFLIDRDGYYISKGANRQISFRLAGQVYPSEEFDAKYDRPDLVLKTLGATDQVLIQDYAAAYQRRLQRLGITEDSIQATAALPEVKIISREIRNRELHLKVEARDSSSQLRKLLIADNGVVAISSEIPPSGAAKWSADVVIPLSPGSNLVNVSAVAKNGRESRREMLAAYNDQPDQKHDLYVLAVGVSRYLARQYDLHYPDKDAQQFAEVLQSQRSQYGQVHATVLLNEQATRAAILRAADELRSAKAEDTVILFFAGHGLVDERSQFFFGTFDVDFSDPSKSGLSWDDLDSILASFTSRHKLIMMDSCHSGELDPQPAPVHPVPQSSPANSVVMRSPGGARGSHLMNESQEETSTELLTEDFEDLRRGTGASVIGASAGSEFSFESESLKNGVFTHVILEGITSGKADLNQDGKITVEELKRYAAQQVSALTGGKQHPVSRAGNPDMDFTVALPRNLLFVRMLETWTEAIGISRDLKYLSTIANNTLRTWDIPSGTEIRRQPLPPGLPTLVVNGSTIRVTNGSTVWDFPAGPGPMTSTVNAGRYNSIDPPLLSPDGKRFVYFDVGDKEHEPKGVLVNADSGKIFASWPQPDYKSDLQRSAFSPDGRSFAVFMGSGEIMIRDGLSGEKQTRIRTPGVVEAIAFSHGGRLLAAATLDNRVLLFNLSTKGQPRSLGILDKRQYFPALLFSDDDKLLITGSSDGYIRLFSTANGTLVGEIWNADWAYRLLLSPGSHILAVGGYRGGVRLWDLSPWLSPH
ncbi:MAG: caspase family protein, partial [Candidatus Acidiferrales bacterium]